MESSDQQMTCMEVWGGNQTVDSHVSMAGLDAWVYAVPHMQSEAGGDVYYVSSCATGRITRLLLADVAGHGSGVSDIAVALRTLMRKFVNFIDQTRFVKSMNEQFLEYSADGTFATAIVATYFAPTRSLALCNAGHPPPLLYRAKTGIWSLVEFDTTKVKGLVNLPLGIVDITDYRQVELELDIGDFVLCYTDSLVESAEPTGELLGPSRLLEIASSIETVDVAAVVPALLAKLRTLHPTNLETDDVTVLMFRSNESAAHLPFANQLLGPVRFIRSLFRDRVIALPDMRVANVLGAVVPYFSRFWKPGGPGGSREPAKRA